MMELWCFTRVAENIDDILSHHPSASIYICGDFSIHHEKWLINSNKTNEEGKWCHDYSITYELSKIRNKPTYVSNIIGHHANLLNLFLTSFPDKCSAEVLTLLCSSDHSLINVKIDAKPKTSSNVPFHRTIFWYTKTD